MSAGHTPSAEHDDTLDTFFETTTAALTGLETKPVGGYAGGVKLRVPWLAEDRKALAVLGELTNGKPAGVAVPRTSGAATSGGVAHGGGGACAERWVKR